MWYYKPGAFGGKKSRFLDGVTDNKNNEGKKKAHIFFSSMLFSHSPSGLRLVPLSALLLPPIPKNALFFSLSSMKLAKQNTTTETGTGHFFFTFQLLCIFLAHDGSFACASLYYMSRTVSDFSPPIGTINIENRCCCSVVVVV